ncbi:hypothetical protein EB151_08225, partial [archaeon]|nr:hypothetical protein [archaeon]
AVGTENSTQIKIEASNANRPDGKLILNYYQDQTSPSITTSFEVDNKFRIGAESGENLKIKIKADEPIASGLINLNGWGIDITDNIEIDSLNNKIGYYILDVPSNSVLTEGMTSISMEITDLAGNYNTSTASVVLANSRVPTNGEIESVAHFTWLIDTGYDGSSAVLTQDIDLQGITFYPMSYIKAYNDNNTNFGSSEAKLNLDGGGFKISNLFIDSSSYDFPFTSLVGRSSSSTHIRNINFDNAHVISENSYTAILVSSVYNGNFHDITIENSRVDVLGSANTDYVSLVLAQGDHLGSARTNIIFKNNTINAPKSNRVGLLVGQGNFPRNHWYNISSENDSIYAKSHGIGMIMGIINNAGWGNNDGLIFEDVSVQNGFISISENPDQVGMLFGRYENSVSPSNQAESEDDSIYNWNRISATGTITTELDSTNNRGYNVGGLAGYMQHGKKFKNIYSQVVIDLTSQTQSQQSIGGIFGYHNISSHHIIRHGYFAGEIKLNSSVTHEKVGALIGGLQNGGDSAGTKYDGLFYNGEINNTLSALGERESEFALSTVESKTTEEMKNISTYLSVGWDFIEETDNGISDDWSIDNSSFSDNLNKGYPYFDNESFSDSTLIRLPVRILPNTDIRARTTVASVTFTAIVPEGGATNITATSLDTNIVDVEVTNTQTQDSITTALLTFTYKGAVGTENSTQIKIEASNANRPDGKLILNYYQDQT